MPFKYGYSIPAVHGDYFLALTPAGKPNTGGLAVYLIGHEKPIYSDPKVGHGIRFDEVGAWKRRGIPKESSLALGL